MPHFADLTSNMKSNFFSIFAIFAFVLSGVAVVSAQDDPSRTFEVRLPVTVTHKKELITGLTRGDFAVFESGAIMLGAALFELIAARYERRSLLITANQPFGAWDAIFPDPAMTVAASMPPMPSSLKPMPS